MAIVLAAVPGAGAGEASGFDELSGGEYRGWAIAAGPATVQTTDIAVTGSFVLDIPFTVPLEGGPTSGTWDMQGSSFWTISFGSLGDATSNQSHTAVGPVTGDRTTLVLGQTSITSTGSITAPLLDVIPVDNADPIGPMELEYTGILCDYAWGEWILSWSTEMDEGGFVDVGFQGDWGADRIPLPDDPSREDYDAILPELASLQIDIATAMQSPSQLEGVPILPYDTIWGLITRAVTLVNELNNLSACDRALIGPDQVNGYINRLTGLLQVLVTVLMDNVRLQETDLTAEDMLELTTMLSSVGAIGEGAVRDVADTVESVVEERIDIIVNNAESAVTDPIGFAGDRAETIFDFVFGGGE